jgi:hypothetical protein
MNSTTKRALLVTLCLASFAGAGCTTMESMQGSQEALAEEKIRAGDKVILHYNDGRSEEIKITDIGDETVSGVAGKGRKVVASYEDIGSIGHKEVEVLKTVGATVGIIALSPLIIVGVMAGAAGC